MGKIISLHKVATLQALHVLALKYIFNRKNMTYEEEKKLMESIEIWSRAVNMTVEQKLLLKAVISALLAEENGEWKKNKELMKKHKLDYRRVWRNGLEMRN